MVGAGADDAETDTPHSDAHHKVPVAALREPAAAREPDRDDDGDEQRQPVEVENERPDMHGAVVGRRDVRDEHIPILPIGAVGRTPGRT